MAARSVALSESSAVSEPRGEPGGSLRAQQQLLLPSSPLRTFVRAFQYHAPLQPIDGGAQPVWPYPHPSLIVFTGPAPEVVDWPDLRRHRLPGAILTGPVTRHVADVYPSGLGTAQFGILFQPGALYRLFGLSPVESLDQAAPARALLGDWVTVLCRLVRAARTPLEMVRIAESTLLPRLPAARPAAAVDRAAALQLRAHGQLSVAELVSASGCSRQRFEREFVARMGVGPKLFARVVRFGYALQLRDADAAASWMDISHEAGYFDQNHLVKEFKAMTGRLPSCPFDMQWRPGAGQRVDHGHGLGHLEDVDTRVG